LSGKPVKGSGTGARTGAHALALLAVPLNSAILHSLSSGPKRQVELRRECGSPAQSTLRSHLKVLEGIGTIAKQRRSAFPRSIEYELVEPGRELRFVDAALERWLSEAPEEPLEPGSDSAKAATEALVEGWSSTIVRVLAGRRLSLTELDGLIGALNYPALERRLASMRLAGMVEPAPGNGREKPYVLTEWLRRGIAPIAAASRWERRNVPESTAGIDRIDAEAGLLLAVQLLRLPAEVSGSCRLTIEVADGSEAERATVVVAVSGGSALPIVPPGDQATDSWIAGPPNAWFRAVIEADFAHLEVGGHKRLATAVLQSLNAALFSPAGRP
jgi:DNA-binding HxlR family transcriptional regulator